MGAPASMDDCYHLRDPNPAPCEGCRYLPGCSAHCRLFTAYVGAVRDQKAKAEYLEGLATGKGRGEFPETGAERAMAACRSLCGEFTSTMARQAYQRLYSKSLSGTAMNAYLASFCKSGEIVKRSWSTYEVVR